MRPPRQQASSVWWASTAALQCSKQMTTTPVLELPFNALQFLVTNQDRIWRRQAKREAESKALAPQNPMLLA